MKTSFLLSAITLLSTQFSYGQVPSYAWGKAFGGEGKEFINAISRDYRGNLYTTGSFEGTVDFDPGSGTMFASSKGGTDIFISKFNDKGELLWSKTIGSTDNDAGYGICNDPDGNVYATGSFQGSADFGGSFHANASGGDDIYIVKYDPDGNILWLKTLGAYYNDYGRGIAADPLGGVYITGKFQSYIDFDPGAGTAILMSAGSTDDAFILKLDANGEYQWAKAIGTTSYDVGTAVSADKSGNVYIAGLFSGGVNFDPVLGSYVLRSEGLVDAYIAKYDKMGTFQWAKNFGGPQNDYVRAVTVDANNNVYAAGYFSGEAIFDRYSTDVSLKSKGAHDGFVCKLSSSGSLIWNKQLGGNQSDYVYGIAVDEKANVYTTGSFQGLGDFDPGASSLSLSSKGGLDIFISKLDIEGNAVWAKSMGSFTDDEGMAIVVSATGEEVYSAGYFRNEIDLDPGTPVVSALSKGEADVYIHKLSVSSSGIGDEYLADLTVKVFPNPLENNLYVDLSQTGLYDFTLSVRDIYGTQLMVQEMKEERTVLNFTGYPVGNYFVSVLDKQHNILKTIPVLKK